MTATKKRTSTAVTSMSEDEVIELMKITQGDQSLTAFAAEIGVTPAYISDIYHRRRSPGPAILKYFGLNKQTQTIVKYVFFKK